MKKNYNIREGFKILKDKEPVDELISITRRYPFFINSTVEEMLLALGHISLRSLENKLRDKGLGIKKEVVEDKRTELEKGVEKIEKEEDISSLSFKKEELKKEPRKIKIKDVEEAIEKVEEDNVPLEKPKKKAKKVETSRQRRVKAASIKEEEKEAGEIKEEFKKETKEKVKKFKKGKDKEGDADKYFDEMFD